MDIATIDLETYWDTDYSLSKMTPLEYVMGSKFELQSCAIKVNNFYTDVFFGEAQIKKCLGKLDWSKFAILGHNMSGFDAYVLAYRLGIVPKMWMCTLAMARPLFAKTVGLSLGKLVEHFKIGRKNNAVLIQTKGRRLAEFTPEEREAMATYNRDDTEQCWALFNVLKVHYTASELWQIDALTRMRTEPKFVIDVPMLEAAQSIERDRKKKAILELAGMLRRESAPEDGEDFWGDEERVLEFVRSELASAPKFSALLEAQGVEVPMKASPTNPEKMVPALAKTDQDFIDLQEHDNPIVAAAARARLSVKSTLLETRIDKFITASSLAGGRLPVPIRYCGADTTGRDSGEEYNCQNLPAIRGPSAPAHALRLSMKAPKGYKVIVADQSGIELRVNHFLWKVPSSMRLYRASPDKADLYKEFAAESLFKIPEDQVTKHQRQIGKVSHLSLGFGGSAPVFQRMAKTLGGLTIPLTPEERNGQELAATEIVAAWRTKYAEIVEGWKACGKALEWIYMGKEFPVDPWGLVHTRPGGLELPSGRMIRYPNLRKEADGQWPDGRDKESWFYGDGRHKARITGPKADENIVQALARDSIFDCAVDFFRSTKLRPQLRVHDELVYIVPEKEAEPMLAELQRILRKAPRWWPELITWSEGDVAGSYGEAK